MPRFEGKPGASWPSQVRRLSHRSWLRGSLLTATASTALIASPMPAQAQNAPAAGAANAEANGEQEIIVTARKREESALKVPVIENVITQQKIEDAAIVDIKDIARFAPGTVAGDSVLAVGTQVSIRGIGTVTLDPGVDQSIAMVIDGFSFTQGLPFQSGTFDLAQIEVLKGPQALFFGKASPAGVISLRTADPGDKLEVIARAQYEIEARAPRAELIFSTPLSNSVGIRIAGQWHKSAGFFFNKDQSPLLSSGALPPDKRLGGDRGWHLRGTLTYKPDSSFSARLKLNYVKDYNEYPGALQMTSCPEGVGAPVATPPAIQYPPAINPNDTCKLDRTFYLVDLNPAAFPAGLNTHGGKPFSDKKQFYGTLEMNAHPVDYMTLTSVTGYYYLDFETYFNTNNSGFSAPHLASSAFLKRHEFTQEIRLNSDFKGPINFTAGMFYQDADIKYLQSTAGNTFQQQRLSSGVIINIPAVISAQSSPLGIQSWSAFGQLRFRPMREIEIAAGGRYTDETRKEFPICIAGAACTPLGGPGHNFLTLHPIINSKTFSPEATVTYYPNDDMTFFASYKKGYKSGSYSLSRLPGAVAPNPFPDNSFGDEKAEGGEVGFKGRLLDRQLTTNIAFYYYKFSGLQFSISEGGSVSGALPTVRVVNAGSARVYGIDFEANYHPRAIEGLNLNLAVLYNNNKFTDLAGVPCYGGQTINPVPGTLNQGGCNQALNPSTGLFTAQRNLRGLPLPRASKWTVNFGFVYDIPFGNGWSLKLTNDNHYASKQLLNLGLRDDYFQGAYWKVDAGAILSGPNDKWEVALIGKNIFNKITSATCATSDYAVPQFGRVQITGGNSSGRDGIDELACLPERGRSLIVRLTVRPFEK